MSPTPIKICKLICFLYDESKLPLHQYLNLDLCRCSVWLDASRTINYCVLRELRLNKVGINNQTLYKCMDHLYGTVCSHSITLFSRIPFPPKTQAKQQRLSLRYRIFYILSTVQSIFTVFDIPHSFMAPLPFLPAQTKSQTRLSSDSKKKNGNKKTSTQPPQTQTLKQTQKLKQKTVSSSSSSSWSQIKNLLSCKQIEGPRVHDPSKITLSSCGSSLCKFSDVIYGNARVIHRSDHSPESSNLGQDGGLLIRKPATRGSSSTVRSNGCGAYTSSSKAMHFRKLSGCYECHMIVDPSRFDILSYLLLKSLNT